MIEIADDQPIIIHPREFILGETVEYFEIPDDLVGRLEGKSSLGRLGIIIHSTAGYVDPGFKGTLTLEISNLANKKQNLTVYLWVMAFLFQLVAPVLVKKIHSRLLLFL